MKSRLIVVGSMLALLVLAGQPATASAGSSVYVGADLGGLVMVFNDGPRYVHHRHPPRYYGGERWHRVPPPPPPRGWYRHHPPPHGYYHGYRRPHHRYDYWYRDRRHDRW